MTVENLGIEVRRDSGVGSFALTVGANSVVRHNILFPSGIGVCPSIITENVSASVTIGVSGNGCVILNNTSAF